MDLVGHESASLVLLCEEDSSSIVGLDDDDNEAGISRKTTTIGFTRKHQGCGFDEYEDGKGDLFLDFPLQSDDCFALLVSQETYHLPQDDYSSRLLNGSLDISFRTDAIDWIEKVHAHYGFGPLSAYLSINYLDRFLSCYELPQGKAWMIQLLSVACLSIAAKMEEKEVPLSLHLQVGEAKYVFEAKTIQRMELLVLSTLKWRMRAVTPFSFTDYFLHKFNDGKSLHGSLLSRSLDLILNTIKRIDFSQFRPSEIAASVALYVTGESQMVDASKALSSCINIDRERSLKCYEMIKDMAQSNKQIKSPSWSASSVPQSPIGVLDNACLSYTSDETTIGSQDDSHHSSPVAKRRKTSILPPS